MKIDKTTNLANKYKNSSILVTGGAGYIGTNIVAKLLEKDVDIVVVDNFSNSYKKNITKIKKLNSKKIKLYNFDLLNIKKLEEVFKTENIVCVVHLAGKKYVQESFLKTNDYNLNNVVLTKELLKICEKFSVKNIVFSSSITVYGTPTTDVVDEKHVLKPVSPYAKQKMQCEKILKKWQQKNNANVAVLRLSNPLGANKHFLVGDTPKTKKYEGVLPYIIQSVKNNQTLVFNKATNQTKDGTSLRDYIHVEDVASAFVQGALNTPSGFNVFNVGSGAPGNSVLDIKTEVEKALNKKVEHLFREAKKGDASIFVTNNNLAKKQLNLKITNNLTDMIKSQIDCEKI